MALIWHGDKVYKKIRTVAHERVEKACLIVEAVVKSSMKLGGRTESGEVAYAGISAKTGRKIKAFDPKTGKKGISRVGTFASKAGEVPRTQTGRLRSSITHEMHDFLPIGRVGTNLFYGKFLELGTAPHRIVAKGDSPLVSKSGQFFGWNVKHPGFAPRPFMRPGLHKSEPLIRGVFGRRMVGE